MVARGGKGGWKTSATFRDATSACVPPSCRRPPSLMISRPAIPPTQSWRGRPMLAPSSPAPFRREWQLLLPRPVRARPHRGLQPPTRPMPFDPLSLPSRPPRGRPPPTRRPSPGATWPVSATFSFNHHGIITHCLLLYAGRPGCCSSSRINHPRVAPPPIPRPTMPCTPTGPIRDRTASNMRHGVETLPSRGSVRILSGPTIWMRRRRVTPR